LLSTEKTNDNVIDTLKLVQLNDEIKNMKNQHETILGEKGVNLSGGQKQRLALARGLIRNTQLLILDDSFSAIDAHTEKKIIEMINSKINNLSVIIISHRLASLKLADKIYVLNNGKIEASGDHDTLLTNSNTYKEVYKNQSSEAGL
jgi:ATP-binding cassette subfamily B protein